MPESTPWRECVKPRGDCIEVDVWYPRTENSPCREVRVGLMDVRAADDIRIHYDFDRDGWVIRQERVVEIEGGGAILSKDPEEWVEAAFLPAWQFEEASDG